MARNKFEIVLNDSAVRLACTAASKLTLVVDGRHFTGIITSFYNRGENFIFAIPDSPNRMQLHVEDIQSASLHINTADIFNG